MEKFEAAFARLVSAASLTYSKHSTKLVLKKFLDS